VARNSRRSSRLSSLRRYLRKSEYWDAWLKESGEHPPDFDAMPSIPYLPDPLSFQGSRIESASQWGARRAEILELFKRYVFGTYPPPPGNVTANVRKRRTHAGGAVVREVMLSFGPKKKAKLHVELAVPPGDGPFPVFMTQRNHIGWARIALARGYAAVVYDGCDAADDTQTFKEIWPQHDWSMLCRRAWGAGRVLDWLHTLPFIDKRNACITGHSRNGKLSLICGAIDERFNVVISSSSGVGGATPYRLCNEAHFGEGIELITYTFPEWLHPRLRFFAGREDKLPVDANLLLALNAPRVVLVSTALNDGCESVLANERAVDSARDAWELLEADGLRKLYLLWREGGHETTARDIERYIDWCDIHLGKVDIQEKQRLWGSLPEIRHFTYGFGAWKWRSREAMSPETYPERASLGETLSDDLTEWQGGQTDRRERMMFLLGKAPPVAPRPATSYGAEPPHIGTLMRRPLMGGPPGIESAAFNMGEYVSGRIYAPAGTMKEPAKKQRAKKKKLPAAVWLHPDSVPAGYSGAYMIGDRHPAPLAKAGFVAIAFDQIGNGGRLHECTRFYERYPKWSLAGKMVRDALSAVAAARDLPYVDPEKVFLVGFGVGGMIAAFAAALDSHIAGAAIVSGFTPMRTDTAARPTGGIARYCLWQGSGLLPRLGFFARSDADARRIPIDFDEILASIAPRPLLCVTPRLDREVNHGDVIEALASVEKVYALHGAKASYWHSAPPDHRRFSMDIQKDLYAKLRRAAGL
jgi:pimeloyl-ACP methyl ester carboxylesterase